MKKFRKMICIIVITLMVSFVCTACGRTYQEAINQEDSAEYSLCGNYFTIITEWSEFGAKYKIVYAKDTKVKYFVVTSGDKFGITPLHNADGTLQVYEE